MRTTPFFPKTSRLASTGLLALMAVCAAPQAMAQTWPSKTVTLVVGTPPGGSVDVYGRALADQLARQTGGTFIVENKAGANGNLSADFVHAASPDGHTLWVSTQAMFTINPSVYPNLRWKPSDFKPIAKGIESPLVLVTHQVNITDLTGEFTAMGEMLAVRHEDGRLRVLARLPV